MQIDPDEIGHAFLASDAPMELTDVLTMTEAGRQGSFAEIGLAAPLFIDDEKTGVVLLGDKLSGRDYADQLPVPGQESQSRVLTRVEPCRG